VLELPGLGSGVGDLAGQADLGAQVVDPAGQGAGLADDDGGAVLGEQGAQVGAVGGEGLEARGGGVAVVDAGNGLVFAQVDGENGGGGRGRGDRGLCVQGKLLWGEG
jgi:hypothetical protein